MDDDGDNDPDVEEDEYDEQDSFWEERRGRERGYRHAHEFNRPEEGGDQEEEIEEDEEEWGSKVDEVLSYDQDADCDVDSD